MRSAIACPGTIPAWAGEPRPTCAPRFRCGDHPRVGGGTRSANLCWSSASGPSPRGRGNHRHCSSDCNIIGTIPAWAGEPGAKGVSLYAKADHPRVGGGTARAGLAPDCPRGPSPRGRGNPRATGPWGCGWGSIPAWAGEPVPVPNGYSISGDHPRVGGGTQSPARTSQFHEGPSPRGRGNPAPMSRSPPTLGTIPAWAGEPYRECNNVCYRRDHPRVGGGTDGATWTLRYDPGPSPRGRGNRRMRPRPKWRNGTIPAWAGEPI